MLDAAVEDNLIKLERKIGTKGNKSGVEEKAYRLPTSDMLPRERHDWYCFHCHSGGEVLLCSACHRVFHENCLKAERLAAFKIKAKKDDEEEDDDEDEDMDNQEWTCVICISMQRVPETFNKKERKDLNHLLKLLCNKLKNKLPGPILSREVPQSQKNMFDANKNNGDKSVKYEVNEGAASQNAEGTEGGSNPATPNNKSEAEKQKEELWRAKFLLKQQVIVININIHTKIS